MYIERLCYYYQDGMMNGPFTLRQMFDFVDSGELREDTFVCREGDSKWSIIKDHDYLYVMTKEKAAAIKIVAERLDPEFLTSLSCKLNKLIKRLKGV
jgi:hypothetical protein